MSNPNLDKLKKDVQDADMLLNQWKNDPAKVFVKYGIAKNEVDVQIKTPSSDRQSKPISEKSSCGCGCVATVEFEYEASD